MLVNYIYKSSSKLNACKQLTTVLAVPACAVKVVACIAGTKQMTLADTRKGIMRFKNTNNLNSYILIVIIVYS